MHQSQEQQKTKASIQTRDLGEDKTNDASRLQEVFGIIRLQFGMLYLYFMALLWSFCCMKDFMDRFFSVWLFFTLALFNT